MKEDFIKGRPHDGGGVLIEGALIEAGLVFLILGLVFFLVFYIRWKALDHNLYWGLVSVFAIPVAIFYLYFFTPAFLENGNLFLIPILLVHTVVFFFLGRRFLPKNQEEFYGELSAPIVALFALGLAIGGLVIGIVWLI